MVPIIDRILDEVFSSPYGKVAFKPLEQERGFFVHITTTYKVVDPFLKGVHQNVDLWRPNRYNDCWKMSDNDWMR